ncbi:hypothetical protein DITRI_Ditri10aG0047500 [Diplodiscus trichospermus]
MEAEDKEETREDFSRCKVSFRDAVMGDKRLSSSIPMVDLKDMEVSDDKMEDGEEDDKECPTIKLSSQDKRRLCGPWSKALIVKLIGHIVGNNFLVRRLKTLWYIASAMDVIDVGNDVYVIRFASDEEYDRALYNGPWIIADH